MREHEGGVNCSLQRWSFALSSSVLVSVHEERRDASNSKRIPLKVCRKSLSSAENIAAPTESTFAVALALLLLEAQAWADDLLV